MVTIYPVLDNFGRLGSAYRETNDEHAGLENVFNNMPHGETSGTGQKITCGANLCLAVRDL